MHFIIYLKTSFAAKKNWLHKLPALQIFLPMFGHSIRHVWLCFKLQIYWIFAGRWCVIMMMMCDYSCKEQQEILGKSLQLAYKQQSRFLLRSLESRLELRTNSLLFIFNNCIFELWVWLSLVHPLFSNNTYFKQPLRKLVS